MNETTTKAKADFLRAKERLTGALATTSDDKINWSPSSTSRTPVQLVAHAGITIPAFVSVMQGGQFAFNSTEEADSALREAEKEFHTREQALSCLEQGSEAYLNLLETLEAKDLEKDVETPFFTMKVGGMIEMMSGHLLFHAAQIAYVQTAYGDHIWH